MQRTRFWSRVGHWFKPTSASIGGGDGSGGGGRARTGLPGESNSRALQADGRATGVPPSALTSRQPDSDRTEEAYTRIIDLVGSIRSHLELQDRRAERMAPTLERLAEGLANIPDAAKAQIELLGDISRRMESDAERAKNLEESLAQLPHIADSQRETMVSMGRQLDTLNEANERGAGAYGEFRQALAQLTDVADASTASLKQIQADSAAREGNLGRLLEEQTKRLTVLACAAIVLATVAAVVGLFSLWR